MNRSSRALALLIAGLCAFATVGAPVAARSDDPKVVVIVGPVGELTDRYRKYGEVAAREARRRTNSVVTIASPNATWPAVRHALQGASLVIYLGHGNGFPSPHRSQPYPRAQNGLGLNPVAGVDDVAHQYFGELFLARDVKLARGAIVLLSHLCYASGNPEPGGANPSIDVAGQRVDNYAAGWLAAGATAVIADAFAPMDEYIAPLLRGRDSIDRVWRKASTHHGNVIARDSTRTPGAHVRLDPTTPTSGFYRSLVWKAANSNSNGTVELPTKSTVGPPSTALISPSLATLGVRAGLPKVAPAEDAPGIVAAGRGRLMVPLNVPPGVTLPSELRLGVRWQPLDPTSPPSPPASTVMPDAPPSLDLVAPEEPASIVASVTASISEDGLSVAVDLPTQPGRYRLTTTIHDADDVAFDSATQALVGTLVVKVSAPLAVAYGVADSITVIAGSSVDLPVRLANPGSVAWADAPITFDAATGTARSNPAPLLVARWVPLDALGTASPVESMPAPRLAPGEETVVVMGLTTPSGVGNYLLIIDVITPIHGSLAASGAAAADVGVTVIRPAARGRASGGS